MDHPHISLKQLRQRKFLVLLPLLILPFVIILFFLFGGGKGTGTGSESPLAAGLNLKLPDAHFKKGKDKSKMSLYEEAGKDSAIRKEKIKNDPYYLLSHHELELPDSVHPGLQNFLEYRQMKSGNPAENEKKIMDKLATLKSVLQKKTETMQPEPQPIHDFNSKPDSFEKFHNNPGNLKSHDPQLDQLNGMLDKVMAIQHPEILRDSLERMELKHQQLALTVSLNREINDPSTFGNNTESESAGDGQSNRFYDLSENLNLNPDPENSVEAEIPETQTLVSGSTIKLRLLDDIRIAGHLIERNQFIYGTVSLSNERMKIQFSSIRSGNNIFPITLEAFDLDGLAGIFIPGSISREVAQQSGDQAINSLGLTTLDPSLGAQAAGAGIQAAKTLISSKVKLIKVTVQAGYRVLLKDSKINSKF